MRDTNEAIFFAIFSILVAVTIYVIVRKFVGNSRSKCTVLVTATVIEIEEKRAAGSRAGQTMVYRPVFSFEWKGFTRTVESRMWASFTKFEVGDKVELYIDPEDSSNFRYKDGFMEPMSFIGISTILVIIVLILALLRR